MSPELEIEYKEASALFQNGFRLILDIIRSYLYFNGILLVAISFMNRGDDNIFRVLTWVICLLGFFGSIAVFIVHRRMTKHLTAWLERAKFIESKFGGSIFSITDTVLHQESDVSPKGTYGIIRGAYLIIALVWIVIGSVSVFG